MAIRLTVSQDPPYAGFRSLEVPGFTPPLYVGWSVEPEVGEAGVDPVVARLLAESWCGYKVWFFRKAPDSSRAPGQWQKESDRTFWVRLSGKISGLCLTSDPGVIETLFDQPGFDWSQQGQIVLLLSLTVGPEQLSAAEVAKAMAEQNPGRLAQLTALAGYARHGDDGDFLELSFRTVDLRKQWLGELARLAHEVGASFSSDVRFSSVSNQS